MTSSGSVLQLPRILHGGTRETEKAWRKCAARAWREGDWAPVVETLELVDADELPGPIIVWNNDRGRILDGLRALWVTRDAVWHLNWILETLPAALQELRTAPEHHWQLVRSGLQYPWYAAGMLQGEGRMLPFLREHFDVYHATETVREQVVRPLLRGFLHWLDDLLTIDSRIATASKAGVELCGVASRLGLVIDLAFCGGLLTDAEMQSLMMRPAQEVIDRLRQVRNELGEAAP